MKQQTAGSKDKDIRASGKALRRAARRARELGARTGTPVYVLEDRQVINITGRELNSRSKH
ncbi:MAG TPA: hypothetical protein VHE60_19220 [Pyrinomonadaceae bacterium]|nr:hypothetical protein [Pyrinomonadaceae bacterium]